MDERSMSAGREDGVPKPVSLPVSPDEVDGEESLRERFLRDGYVILRGAVAPEVCRRAVDAFETEVKPDRGYFLRHASGKFERHVFTPANFMKYPIMNIQDVDGARYPGFRANGLTVLTSEPLRRAVGEIFGEEGRVIHTMFFDGNQQTWAHRDSHYIDSTDVGTMIGVWVAVEDIHPDAGRFYVYAGSHRTPSPEELRLDTIDPNGSAYKASLRTWVEGSGLVRVAPEMRCGDAILWSSLTIHGSLATTEPGRSRKSLTAHYIPVSHDFLWNRHNRGARREILFNGTRIARHKDQWRWRFQARAAGRDALRDLHPGLLRAVIVLRNHCRPPLRWARTVLGSLRGWRAGRV